MLYSVQLTQVRLPDRPGLHCVMVDAHGRIAAIAPQPEPELPTWDLAGDWVSLGGVDVQINGALGLAFPDLTPAIAAKLEAVNALLWEQGVDGYLPTIVTTSLEQIHHALAAIAPAVRSGASVPGQAQILGVHLEGPCLNPAKRGAHPAAQLRSLTVAEMERILGDDGDVVRVITLAPELDESGTVIPYLRSRGITVSLGHSLATAAQAKQAFRQGARMVTHAFNAMPGLHHRQPGLLGAALTTPGVYSGFIADGEHVDPIMLEILLRAGQGEAGLFLVSDALAPLGLSDGRYPWDQREIEVIAGTARLLDGTLSGTTLPLLMGVQNLVRWGICAVETAIALATTAPRRAIGLDAQLVGQPANLLRWHQDPHSGELTYQRLQAAAASNAE